MAQPVAGVPPVEGFPEAGVTATAPPDNALWGLGKEDAIAIPARSSICRTSVPRIKLERIPTPPRAWQGNIVADVLEPIASYRCRASQSRQRFQESIWCSRSVQPWPSRG